MKLETIVKLNTLFERGNKDKSRRVSADRARIILIEEILAKDWFEQCLITESRIKVFFATTPASQHKLIREIREAIQNQDDNVPARDDLQIMEDTAEENTVEQLNDLQAETTEDLNLDL